MNYVINLDRDCEQLDRFKEIYSHIAFIRFSAIDGKSLDRSTLVSTGVIQHDLAYGDGALGSAMSHLTLWREAEMAEIPDGLGRAKIELNQDDLRSNIEAFRTMRCRAAPFRLRHAYGIMCYTISPLGAKKLLSRILPFNNDLIDFEGFGIRTGNTTIDCAMNNAYPSMNAYVCLPPLVASENRHETSSIHLR